LFALPATLQFGPPVSGVDDIHTLFLSQSAKGPEHFIGPVNMVACNAGWDCVCPSADRPTWQVRYTAWRERMAFAWRIGGRENCVFDCLQRKCNCMGIDDGTKLWHYIDVFR
jgi:hypothetical protein